MQLVIVVPGLLARPGRELATLRPLALIARYADTPRLESRGIATAMLAALGIAPDVPIAPLAMLGAGADPGDDYVLRADPVHLAADRDTVVLVQRIDDLSGDAAAALIRTLDAHFAGDGLRFQAVRPNAWFVRRRDVARVETTPIDAAVGKSLLAHLPRGADAGRWKRWQNEIEMLLHEHPTNTEREARCEPAVSGVWFWGGGRLADVGRLPVTAVTATSGVAGDVARGIALQSRGHAAALHADDNAVLALERAAASATPDVHAASLLVVVPSSADGAIEKNWLAPALDLLVQRRVHGLQLIADGHGAAVTWSAQRPSLLRRVAARASRHGLEIPEAER